MSPDLIRREDLAVNKRKLSTSKSEESIVTVICNLLITFLTVFDYLDNATISGESKSFRYVDF